MFALPLRRASRHALSLSLLIAFAVAGCAAAGGASVAPLPTSPSAAPSLAPEVTPGAPAATPSSGRYGSKATTSPAAAAAGVVVKTVMTSLGAVLVGPNGLTLYTHAGDSSTASTCTGSCASAWPPLTVANGGQATGGAGVTGTFGTLIRSDGSTQITYKGHPLYYWSGDSKTGDTSGNGVGGFSVARP